MLLTIYFCTYFSLVILYNLMVIILFYTFCLKFILIYLNFFKSKKIFSNIRLLRIFKYTSLYILCFMQIKFLPVCKQRD